MKAFKIKKKYNTRFGKIFMIMMASMSLLLDLEKILMKN